MTVSQLSLALVLLSGGGMSEAWSDRLAYAAMEAEAATGEDAITLLAVSWVESRWSVECHCSGAGACGLMGILVGRYGNPSKRQVCEVTPASTAAQASFMRGAEILGYFRRHCEGEPLCCYNQGWTDDRDCHYARTVRRKEREILDAVGGHTRRTRR
jgi:hypothetical protein